MDREKAIKAVEDLLAALGEDVARPGLAETPRRVAGSIKGCVQGGTSSYTPPKVWVTPSRVMELLASSCGKE